MVVERQNNTDHGMGWQLLRLGGGQKKKKKKTGWWAHAGSLHSSAFICLKLSAIKKKKKVNCFLETD